jgi:ribose-phosphate pyrophosphokinase
MNKGVYFMILVNNQKIDLNKFPDGTLFIKFEIRSNNAQIQWFYESDSELFALICITNHLRCINYDIELSLYIPYIPHARMDRIKNNDDVFTLKYFADTINSLKFKEVFVLDPHSSVSEALINNIVKIPVICCIQNAYDEVLKLENNNIILFYPDNGATKKYSEMLKNKYAYGLKDRDWNTGKIKGIEIIGNVKDKSILIIDDICSKGGTFYYSAKKLKEMGAKNIYLYITHCENTILEGDLIKSGLITKIFTTNSIFTKEHELIEVSKL